MAGRIHFDSRDKTTLRALVADNEVVTIIGEMEVVITRLAGVGDDHFWLWLKFSNNELLDVQIQRIQLLRELGIEADENT